MCVARKQTKSTEGIRESDDGICEGRSVADQKNLPWNSFPEAQRAKSDKCGGKNKMSSGRSFGKETIGLIVVFQKKEKKKKQSSEK
jgi:hypothetical protein